MPKAHVLETFCLPMPTGFKGEDQIFIYVVRTTRATYLVDTSTHFQNHAELLRQHLEAIGVWQLDFLLLTHCHSDHSGNAKTLKDWFPQMQVVISPLGAGRLRQGGGWFYEREAQQRQFFTYFGCPKKEGEPTFRYVLKAVERPTTLPMIADHLLTPGEWVNDEVEVMFTPGHSEDHVCYGIGEHFFGGDTVLNFIPGMEDVWLGTYDGWQKFLKTASFLKERSADYPQVHHFHGERVPSLKEWYEQMIWPRVIKKYQQILSVMTPEQPKTLAEVMRELHPKYPDHYIYMSQYMGFAWMLAEAGVLVKTEDERGFWWFRCPAQVPSEARLHEVLRGSL